jgi:DNA polymerase-3 subunit epsilon
MFDWLRRRLGHGAPPDGGGLDGRFVVLDTETSGLDARIDRILSIGAVAVRAQRIEAGDCFHELVLQPRTSPHDNILIHGIGAGAQRAGAPLADVLARFEDWAGSDYRVGFHLGFDRHMLERAARETGLPKPAARGWIDLAPLLPHRFPERSGLETLDGSLAAFGLNCANRHDALADAYATALLLLALLRRVRDDPHASAEQLRAESEATARLRAMAR